MKQSYQSQFCPSLERVQSLQLQQISYDQLPSKLYATKTTRQQQSSSQNSLSYLKNNRSLLKKGIYSHKLVQDTQQMQSSQFIQKYLKNPFFRNQVKLLLGDYSSKTSSETNFNYKQGKIIEQNQYGLQTLKSQRQQTIREGYQIQQKWLKWLQNAGIDINKK